MGAALFGFYRQGCLRSHSKPVTMPRQVLWSPDTQDGAPSLEPCCVGSHVEAREWTA